jgi:glycosyltransferase involved in cell wall biosynthesis
MRIGIYDPYFDDLGGGEKYMLTIAECLSRQHEVDLFWDNEKDFAELKKRFSLTLDSIKLHKNIFAPGRNFLNKIAETQKYDVIIVLSDGSIPVTFSKKLFLHIQQPLSHLQGLSWTENLKLPRVNGVFYNSQFTKSYNDRLFPHVASQVIYPPVALKYKETKKENKILHVGRFRVQDTITGIKDFKKQTIMLETFKKMVDTKKVGDWEFIMAVSIKEEDKETFETLQESVKDYPVTFFINKTNDELWEQYNKAKIYWHASGYGEDLKKHPEYAEHFGISTVEAMGAGVVPVVINAGGQQEIVTDEQNGLLWNELSQLSEKTQRLMQDQTFWKKLSQAAKIRAKEFGKEKFCKEVTTMIVK